MVEHIGIFSIKSIFEKSPYFCNIYDYENFRLGIRKFVDSENTV